MKSTSAIAALFLSLLTAPTYMAETAPDGSEKLYNPEITICCECVTIEINGKVPGDEPGESAGPFVQETDGSYRVRVAVTTSEEGICAEASVISVKLVSTDPQGGEIVVPIISPKGVVTDPNLDTIITADMVRTFGHEWEVVVECKGKPLPAGEAGQISPSAANGCKKEFSLSPCENGCSSCQEAAGDPALTEDAESAEAEIPSTSSAGGMSSGSLRYDVPDSGAFAGRGGLETYLPSTFGVTRDGAGLITGVNTGAATMLIFDGPGANAFTILHKDPAGVVFRTTTLSQVTVDGVPRFRMDSTFDGTITRHERIQLAPGSFVLLEGRVTDDVFVPLRRQIQTKEGGNVSRTYRRKVEERASSSHPWHLVSDIATTWEAQIFGWKKTREVIDPDGAALTSAWLYYGPGDIAVLDFAVATGPGGFPAELGRLRHHIRYDGFESFHTYNLYFHNITTPYAGNPAGKTTTYFYDAVNMVQAVTTKVGDNILSSSVRRHGPGSMTLSELNSASGALDTVNTYVPSGIQGLQDFGGKLLRSFHPDGTLTTYSYNRHQPGGGYTTTMENGAPNAGKTAVIKGTRTITTRNSRGTVILSKTEAIGYTGATGLFSSMAVTAVDNLGRALTTAHHSAAPSADPADEEAVAPFPAYNTYTTYSCCGVSSETDMYGVKTFHAYDGLKRRVKSNTLGVTMETVYDGLTTETHRYAFAVDTSLSSTLTDNDINLVSSSYRNLAGTLRESGSPDPTPDPVPPPAPGVPRPLVKTTSEITYKPATGLSMRQVTTTPDNFSQTTDSFLDGRTSRTTGQLSPAMQYAYSVNPTGELTSRSYLDGANLRETTTTQSDWAGRTLRMDYMDASFATMHYNAKGQLVRTVDPDGVVTLHAHNSRGERTVTATDLFPAANYNDDADNITYGTDTVQSSETLPATGTIGAYSGPVWKTVSKVWQDGQLDPATGTIVSTSLRSADGLHSSTESIGVASLAISGTALAGNGEWIVESKNPDGSKSVASYEGGLLRSNAVRDSANALIDSVTYGYDHLNRTTSQTDLRRDSIAVLPSNYPPGAYTSHLTSYLSDTADYVKSTGEPVNLLTKYTYDIRGRRITTDAPDTMDADGNPLPNITNTAYNPDGTVQETSGAQTYRTTHTYDYAQRMVTLTTYGTETAVTAWKYSPDRGFLTEKNYDGETGNGPGNTADYAHSPAGRLLARAWERGVSTIYAYDNGGRMVSANHSDTTPDVATTYDALNRPLTVKNGAGGIVGGVLSIGTPLSSGSFVYDSTLALDTETITYNIPGQSAFTRVIDRSRDSLNRTNGFELKSGTTVENQAAYTYDTAGRLSTVRREDIPVPQEFTYGYEPNSYGMLKTVTGPAHTVTNIYETYRNILESKENEVATTNISTYQYGVNSIGQRTGVSTTGSAFAVSRDIAWGYDSLGQVTKADSSIPGLDRAYLYDEIGNRLKSADSLTLPASNNYTPTALNQYEAIGTLDPAYDLDGNATDYPLPANLSANSTLGWDAENRLISASVPGGDTTTYHYDSQSRRIATVSTAGVASLVIYDGWNPVAYYTGNVGTTPTLAKANLWGMDLSGSMQGAGGVGGLLAVTNGTGTYYPTYDGNGNVSEYLNSTGAVVAHYEYDPFGKTTVATGSKAQDFSHRFSTKPLDTDTGLYYYGYRYYDPVTGRWPSRDPIAERGGVNLYGFVFNSPCEWIDRLGWEPQKEIPSNKYWNEWIKQFGADDLTKEQIADLKEQFEDGCIGITCINTGSKHKPDLSNCYSAASGNMKDVQAALDKAKKRRDQMVKDGECESCDPLPYKKNSEPRIFSVRLYSNNKRFTRKGLDDSINLSQWNMKKGKPKTREEREKFGGDQWTQFDFGLYDEANNRWVHANHEAPGMIVKISTLEQYSVETDIWDTQVFCVACEDWKW